MQREANVAGVGVDVHYKFSQATMRDAAGHVVGRDVLCSHNTKIMSLRPLTALFGGLGLEPVWYGYCGMFQLFGMSLRHERSFRGLVERGLDRVDSMVDHLMFLGLRGAAFETRWSSNLVFIGRHSG